MRRPRNLAGMDECARVGWAAYEALAAAGPGARMHGDYIADGRLVRRQPTRTETGIKMGFIVCEIADGLSDDAAQEIADALNMHKQQHPEKH